MASRRGTGVAVKGRFWLVHPVEGLGRTLAIGLSVND
jgi:hypothetical protein